MSTTSRHPKRRLAAAALLPLALLQLLSTGPAPIHCLGPQDLNKQHPSIRSIHSPTFKHSFQRPVLSNRFSSSLQQAPTLGQLSAQASSQAPSSIFSPDAPANPQTPANVSSIEQMMKNALARTVHLNSAASEPAAVLSELEAPPEAPTAARSRQQQPADPQPDPASKPSDDAAADSSRAQPEPTLPVDPSSPANNHETVYSEQRFANLFARRNSLKKSRLQPHEQVKARPTLPSFIKSPPDPKQFAATQIQQQTTDSKPLPSSFVQSSRLQQQQQATNKINLANQAKKASITSNSASIANNKRTTSLAQANSGNKSALGPKSTSNKTSPTVAINKPSSSNPTPTNPFNRSSSQQTSSDPANVIAMARKRLLANNALESAKLKQQQQQQLQRQQASSTK